MGWNANLICLTCETETEIDVETDCEELIEWMIEHWGHNAKIEWYEEGELISKELKGVKTE